MNVSRAARLSLAAALLVGATACTPEGVGGAEPNPAYTGVKPWDDLDAKPAPDNELPGRIVPAPDSTIPTVVDGEPVGPDDIQFILTVYDNHGSFFDLGEQGYAATVTISGLTADFQPITVNGEPVQQTVTRVLPYAFRMYRTDPSIAAIGILALVGLPSGWKVRCDIRHGGQPVGGFTEGISPGDAGIHMAEVYCDWRLPG